MVLFFFHHQEHNKKKVGIAPHKSERESAWCPVKSSILAQLPTTAHYTWKAPSDSSGA